MLSYELLDKQAPQALVVWLHGLGADGHDFVPIVPHLPIQAQVAFAFPHAPKRPVTINAGFVMPAWYDIISADIERVVDEKSLEQSAEAVFTLAQTLTKQYALGMDKVIFAGFSQGGAVVYECLSMAAKDGVRVGGGLILSSYIAKAVAQINAPLWILHGTNDDVVPFKLGERAKQTLASMGVDAPLFEYPIGHSVSVEEFAPIGAFIDAIATGKAPQA